MPWARPLLPSMGVPAFFRWLVKKYPKILQNFLEEEYAEVGGVSLPVDISKANPNGMEFDNLYLDMNGIIHPCVHPEDVPAPETEDEMFANICLYVDRLVNAVRPRKLLYMAIDGVAPRAKMNQQRSRRFKAAKEISEQEDVEERLRREMVEQGHKFSGGGKKKKVFDHNVITPGTEFMDRLAQRLRHYVHQRLSKHPGWRGLKVVLSDASVPGEGEHKIMEFVRDQRARPGYDPSMTHVIHGLDADLIMLGLATHEANFNILREVVETGRRRPGVTPPAPKIFRDGDAGIPMKPLQLLRVPVLREYLELEFAGLAAPHVLPFAFDLERVIDDFVFMCFFVGNDFLPHLPSLDIREGALDMILMLYKQLLPALDGFLTDAGEVNLDRVDVLLARIGTLEDRIFQMRKERHLAEESDRKRGAITGAQPRVGEFGNKTNAPRHMLELHRVGHTDPALPSYTRRSLEASAARARALSDGRPLVPDAGQLAAQAVDNKAAAADLRASLFGTRPPKRSHEGDGESAAKRTKETEPADKSSPAEPEQGEDKSSPKEEDEEEEDDLLDDATKRDLRDSAGELKEAVEAELKAKRELDEVPDEVRLGEDGFKDRYYKSKFGPERGSDPEFRRTMFAAYIEGLLWVFHYYYKGVASWRWFYPQHYAPFASDLVDVGQYRPKEWDLGRPFRPIEQLMGTLPPRSSHAVPTACARLMTEASSPIREFYPLDFQEDPNGHRFTWQFVALLPFVDASRLTEAVQSVEDTFTEDEKRRNTQGHSVLCFHSSHPLAKLVAPLVPKLGEAFVVREKDTSGEFVVAVSCTETDSDRKGVTLLLGRDPQATPLEDTVYPPPGAHTDPVLNNQTVAVRSLPNGTLPHSCKLLPGAPKARPELSPTDIPQALPRMGRFHWLNVAKLIDVQQMYHAQAEGAMFAAGLRGTHLGAMQSALARPSHAGYSRGSLSSSRPPPRGYGYGGPPRGGGGGQQHWEARPPPRGYGYGGPPRGGGGGQQHWEARPHPGGQQPPRPRPNAAVGLAAAFLASGLTGGPRPRQ
jgi:5'-3' exoribonuclease 2